MTALHPHRPRIHELAPIGLLLELSRLNWDVVLYWSRQRIAEVLADLFTGLLSKVDLGDLGGHERTTSVSILILFDRRAKIVGITPDLA